MAGLVGIGRSCHSQFAPRPGGGPVRLPAVAVDRVDSPPSGRGLLRSCPRLGGVFDSLLVRVSEHTDGLFGGSSAGFVVTALKAASAVSRDVTKRSPPTTSHQGGYEGSEYQRSAALTIRSVSPTV